MLPPRAAPPRLFFLQTSMMRNLLSPKRLLALSGLAALALAANQGPASNETDRELVLVPHVIRSASDLVGVAASVMVYDPVDGRRVQIERLQDDVFPSGGARGGREVQEFAGGYRCR